VTPSCRKFEATSTVMPEIRMLADHSSKP